MKIVLTALLFCLSALPAMADVTKADIKKLLDAKVSDKVITQYVKTNAPVRMTASDLASLKTSGASDNVLTILAQYMRNEPVVRYVYVYPAYYWYPRYHYVYIRRPIVVRRCR